MPRRARGGDGAAMRPVAPRPGLSDGVRPRRDPRSARAPSPMCAAALARPLPSSLIGPLRFGPKTRPVLGDLPSKAYEWVMLGQDFVRRHACLVNDRVLLVTAGCDVGDGPKMCERRDETHVGPLQFGEGEVNLRGEVISTEDAYLRFEHLPSRFERRNRGFKSLGREFIAKYTSSMITDRVQEVGHEVVRFAGDVVHRIRALLFFIKTRLGDLLGRR